MLAMRLFSLRPMALLAAAAVGYSMFRARKPQLPMPGPNKQDPAKLDKMLDSALEDSMAASDPPSTVQPEVRAAS